MNIIKWGSIQMKLDSSKILLGILICLIIIALKPTPDYPTYPQPSYPSSLDVFDGESVVPFGENRIAIVSTDYSSGTYGDMIVLEFDDNTGEFVMIGKYNYYEDLHNIE
jgi:hypothetical protein